MGLNAKFSVAVVAMLSACRTVIFETASTYWMIIDHILLAPPHSVTLRQCSLPIHDRAWICRDGLVCQAFHHDRIALLASFATKRGRSIG